MRVVSLYSKSDLIEHLKQQSPQLSCDYMMAINWKGLLYDFNLIVTDFKIPQVGVQFHSHSELGHVQPTGISYTPITISYLRDSLDVDPIHAIYDTQTVRDVPKFIPQSDLPTVHIYRIAPDTAATLLDDITYMLKSNTHTSLAELVDQFKTVNAHVALDEVAQFLGCRFSFPTPGIDLTADKVAVYSVSISYESFILF